MAVRGESDRQKDHRMPTLEVQPKQISKNDTVIQSVTVLTKSKNVMKYDFPAQPLVRHVWRPSGIFFFLSQEAFAERRPFVLMRD